ncbi:Outer membrane protein assembly factor BamA precursor [Bremerella volcania]|uniref:Outer membrane protein assembly factor BamA n=1 Tax=Bremerella volcania TaxID=2527984 RepID=A0A518CDT2_9BACT|nr:BamA/TamA family outer membrane protein [Bremerella volcania]QDU77379.1 Outer membrane protein assembly factor BamA precursor [Bremerella volcania]
MDRSGQLLKITLALSLFAGTFAGWNSASAQNWTGGSYGQQAAPNWNVQGRDNQGYPGSAQNWDSYDRTAYESSPGNPNQYRGGMPASGAPIGSYDPYQQYQQPVQPVQYQQGYPSPSNPETGMYSQDAAGYPYGSPPIPAPVTGPLNPYGYPPNNGRPLGGARIYDPPLGPDAIISPNPYYDPGRTADLTIRAEEAQTGRFQFGVGINSDAGVTGSIVIDERNFDWRRYPSSFDDVWNGRAWRGAGQGFRIEAMPGTQVQRYMVSFSEPYLFDTRVSLNLSGYFFNRIYRDWDEQRVGGRVGLGYRLTPDLSTAVSLRMEDVEISDPRVPGVPELDAVLGHNDLYTGSWSITHDTRDLAFAPTEGHLFEINLEQAFGEYSYSRAEVDFRQYFLLGERPDGSGRHTLGFSTRAGFSGADTPIFENFYAGGFSTLRGFDFRRVGPKSGDVFVGGPFRLLGSVEYMFPITADDMVKGVLFTDVGAVEESTKIVWDDFDVAPGFGLRISVPALGQAPIALDFAFPINHADTDQTQVFSFFVGAAR